MQIGKQKENKEMAEQQDKLYNNRSKPRHRRPSIHLPASPTAMRSAAREPTTRPRCVFKCLRPAARDQQAGVGAASFFMILNRSDVAHSHHPSSQCSGAGWVVKYNKRESSNVLNQTCCLLCRAGRETVKRCSKLQCHRVRTKSLFSGRARRTFWNGAQN